MAFNPHRFRSHLTKCLRPFVRPFMRSSLRSSVLPSNPQKIEGSQQMDARLCAIKSRLMWARPPDGGGDSGGFGYVEITVHFTREART